MKNIFLYVEGCERRVLDTKKIYNYLIKNGYRIVYRPKDADVIIYITCAVFCNDVDNAIKKVKEFQECNAELIVAGCLPEMEKEELSKVFSGRTISTKDIDRIDELFPEHKIKFNRIDDANISYLNTDYSKPLDAIIKILRLSKPVEKFAIKLKDYVFKKILEENSVLYRTFANNDLYQIRISWGCSFNCSYCTIPKAVGPHRSKPLNQCIQEFKKGLEQGFTRFVITADDSGAYGLDIESNLPELLDKITEIEGNYEIEIHALSVVWIIKYIDTLEEILKREKIKTILAPIESGSDRILKLMHRYHNTGKMKEAFLRLKKAYPDLTLETHYLVGFPSETEEDIKQTLDFIKEINFDTVYIFPFSCKTGSKAENMELKFSDEEINRRLRYVKKNLKKVAVPVLTIK